MATTTSSTLPADAPLCGPEVITPIKGIGLQASILHSYPEDIITDADRAWAATVPIPESVYPTGLFNVTGEGRRSDGTELAGEKIVSISVMHCSPALTGQAIAIAHAEGVPLDALQIYGERG